MLGGVCTGAAAYSWWQSFKLSLMQKASPMVTRAAKKVVGPILT